MIMAATAAEMPEGMMQEPASPELEKAVQGAGPLRVVFFTDVHARAEWGTPRALRQTAAAINALRPDLVIAGGDMITDGFQSPVSNAQARWQVYLENLHNRIAAPVYPVFGNHDFVAVRPEDGSAPLDEPRSVFLEHFGQERTYRSFDAAGYHFILLDSMCLTNNRYGYEGRISAEQVAWLQDDLNRVARETPIIMALHMPLLTAFYQAYYGADRLPPPRCTVLNNRDILKLFEDRNLILVLQGHTHARETIRFNGIHFLNGGAVCAKWWRGPWYDTPEGFLCLDLHGEEIDAEYIPTGWHARRPPDQ
jgi:predicted phosphodiesterase